MNSELTFPLDVGPWTLDELTLNVKRLVRRLVRHSWAAGVSDGGSRFRQALAKVDERCYSVRRWTLDVGPFLPLNPEL